MTITKEHRKKIRAILAWYRYVAARLTLTKKLELLKMWTETCIHYEEYEMAMALRKARSNLLRSIRLAEKGQRTILGDIRIYFKIAIRKLKRTILFQQAFSKSQ